MLSLLLLLVVGCWLPLLVNVIGCCSLLVLLLLVLYMWRFVVQALIVTDKLFNGCRCCFTCSLRVVVVLLLVPFLLLFLLLLALVCCCLCRSAGFSVAAIAVLVAVAVAVAVYW